MYVKQTPCCLVCAIVVCTASYLTAPHLSLRLLLPDLLIADSLERLSRINLLYSRAVNPNRDGVVFSKISILWCNPYSLINTGVCPVLSKISRMCCCWHVCYLCFFVGKLFPLIYKVRTIACISWYT